MSRAIVWFRQDLRLDDNPALAQACANHQEILCLYILEEEPSIPLGSAQRWWLHHSLTCLDQQLQKHGLQLILKSGAVITVIDNLIEAHKIDAIYWNRLYEPAHIRRDKQVKTKLQSRDLTVESFNGSLLNEPWTVKNQSGSYFKVFTPFWKQCLRQIDLPKIKKIDSWPQSIKENSDNIDDWNLRPGKPNWAKAFSNYWQPGSKGAWLKLEYFLEEHLNVYREARDVPKLMATSRLSPHLHFGEISPMQVWRATQDVKNDPETNQKSADSFLSEVGWREFSYHLLFHFPKLITDNFRSEFDDFPWHDDQEALRRWQKGITGYPIVDAGMRELWKTGYMHNRVRMIVASFLTKDLFIDWRKGAAWFDDTLLDADQASNYASWQWTAGCGADAAPYFRIFNPVLQGEKFDPEGVYIRKFVPELEEVPNKWIHKPWQAPVDELPFQLGDTYPEPIVDHSDAREKALKYYQQIKKG